MNNFGMDFSCWGRVALFSDILDFCSTKKNAELRLHPPESRRSVELGDWMKKPLSHHRGIVEFVWSLPWKKRPNRTLFVENLPPEVWWDAVVSVFPANGVLFLKKNQLQICRFGKKQTRVQMILNVISSSNAEVDSYCIEWMLSSEALGSSCGS